MAISILPPDPLPDDSQPSWFTPKRLLVIFCIINMLNYVDRGVIASNGVNGSPRTCSDSGICTSGSGIQGDFNLNFFEDGVLSSAFMVGLLIASPIFASLSKRLVGVGEASFISLAAPFVDDNAPPGQKTAWLGVFYMCIPTGIALGYVYGGLVGANLYWRVAFWGEALFMLPFAISGFLIEPLHLKGFNSSEAKTISSLDRGGLKIQGEHTLESNALTNNGDLNSKANRSSILCRPKTKLKILGGSMAQW